MRAHKVKMATLVVLALGGLVSANCGVAVADGRGAEARGGSAGGDLFEENTAQESKQNNICSGSPSGVFPVLTDSRRDVRCATDDASLNKDNVVKGGGARAEGGSGPTRVNQQNTAQKGRQNNNCARLNRSGGNVQADREDSRCVDKDASRNKHTKVKGGGARAEGGPAIAGPLLEQNTAQEGRQNNNCANLNGTSVTTLTARRDSRCGNKDASRNKRTKVKGGGARAEGGSGAAVAIEQNTAQEGRQNNNCANPNNTAIDATGGARRDSRCGNKDASRNKHTKVKGGGARAEGGPSAGPLFQQNTAQEGRQNNNCANPNGSTVVLNGGRQDSRCGNKDASRNKHTKVKGGGARAEGGSGAGIVSQQNSAQEGRQNNNCANLNGSTTVLTGSDDETGCLTVDASTNKGTVERGGGAEAEGGSGLMNLTQQNTAQSGRQNNNCGNPNSLSLTATGSRTRTECVAVDRSTNIHSVHH
ncbi:hypothetical protein ABZ016_20755 [Streptomyces sp. NPDC006372]|uniref:hypothetical protein n=1 Tax=Streptomyces sp. NPDC006372 TaxID=3155599 RepID=UPI0033A964F1